MNRLPRALRLFWALYIPLMLAALLAPSLGPAIEGRVAPVRIDQRIDPVHRDRAFLRFAWISTKLRAPPFVDIDVALITPRDRFVVTLYSDDSPPGAPACTIIVPWSRSHARPVGPLEQRHCVEVPRTVDIAEPVNLDVVVRYRGLWGLWDVPLRLPPIRSDRTDAPA